MFPTMISVIVVFPIFSKYIISGLNMSGIKEEREQISMKEMM